MPEQSTMSRYFENLKNELNRAYSLASEARKKGLDPSEEVEVKIAKDVAARVEGIVGPPGVAEVIRNLEQSGMSREDISFEVARKIAAGEIIKGSKEQMIEQAVRTGLGIITEGVLVAPTEGIAKVRIKKNPDGTDYVAVYYAGPIRSAGGTAAALSLVLADIARRVCGVGDYRATETQVMRIMEEIMTYETRCVHLQYLPSEEHQRIIIEHCPVCVDGEPTEDIEVSAYRNVPGIETNRVRSGVALVICDGLALKAAKLMKITKKLKLGWDWIEKVVKVKQKEDKIEVKPDASYLEGLVAGRPVFCHPSAKGGFRLRYGRSETNSLMSRTIHTATMILLDNFLAYGTHMKIERPGKGCVVGAHEGLEPPAVRLRSGRVMKVRTLEEAHAIKSQIEKIIFLGDILTTYGDFLKSNHPLLPSGYCTEWWERQIEAKGVEIPQATDAQTLIEFSRTHQIPLHPDYTFHWHDINSTQLKELSDWIRTGKLEVENGKIRELKIKIVGSEIGEEKARAAKERLEDIILEHRYIEGEVIIESELAYAFLSSMGALKEETGDKNRELKMDFTDFDALYNSTTEKEAKTTLEILNKFLPIKPKAPTYIGGRMGRPEKAKERKMDGSPSVMFPTGSFKNRSVSKQYRTVKTQDGERTINLDIIRLKCPKCARICFYKKCDVCGTKTIQENTCTRCGQITSASMHCETKTSPYEKRPIDIITLFDNVKNKLGFAPEEVKGVKGLTNVTRIPERLEKGFLRSKHRVYVFRDGTSRFDATDIPLTHFKPKDIGLSVEKARELGYLKDYLGNDLKDSSQIVTMFHQDIVLAEDGALYFTNVANFIDDMLVNLYGLASFYNIKKKHDLLGHLAVGLSPHTSAGVLCRIIGFTKATVGYGHPYFHTAKRRNCFHADTEIVIYDTSKKEYVYGNLGSITEKLLNSTEEIKKLDDKTIRVKAPKNLEVFSIDPKTSKIISQPIKCFIKSTNHEKWVEIETTTNRKMLVTADHNVLFSSKGKLESCEASLVRPGFDIPVVLNTKFKGKFAGKINLSEQFAELDSVEKQSIVIRAENFFRNLFYSKRKLILDNIPLTENERRNPARWYSRVPLHHFEVLVKLGICTFESLPIDSKLAMKYDNLELPMYINLNKDLMTLLGYYISEGHSRKSNSCYQVSYRICNNELKNYIPDTILRVFRIKPNLSEDNSKVTICSRLVYLLFTQIWQAGKGAYSKRIPKFIYSLEKELLKEFVSAFFDGDGSVVAHPPRIQFYSVSKSLLEDFGTLLSGFGVFARYTKGKPRLPGRTLLERYKKLNKPPKSSIVGSLALYGIDIKKFANICTPRITKKEERMQILRQLKINTERSIKYKNRFFKIPANSFTLDKVKSVRIINKKQDAYCLDIEAPDLISKNILLNNQLFSIRCDGDEDCVMMLMDALLNFSRQYLSESRGGTMDAPLVLSMEINPKEVDDEAHDIEYVTKYPLEFYEAAEKITPPGAVKLKTVKNVLGTDEQYFLPITHPGGSIDRGNVRTAYVELESIPDKIHIQFALQERLKMVDKKDAAERLILSHFIPDLYGNLRSFSRQTFRCVGCNTIARRPPLAGKCARCGGNLLLTINKGGIQKYLEISAQIVNRYGLPNYLKQRLELLEKEIHSIFEDDKVKQTDLSAFL
ncbi:DNA polymerase II large subunit [Candidatus Micrarchaeota archaeon]|nr:DNA polymerase II large subunit [Candidatus Micrarchaeota archaeon]